MSRRHRPRSTYAASTSIQDSLAYIAAGIGQPYPQQPFEKLSDTQLTDTHRWAQVLLYTIEAEIEQRPGLSGDDHE
jgi:hypothetical protein